MSQKIITLVLGVACICLLVVSGILYLFSDRTPPEIRLNDEITYFREGMSEDALLEGVTAFDEEDGDVTSSLRVEVMSYGNGSKAKVTYMAKDSSNNIAKESIIITYGGEEDGNGEEPAEAEGEETADGGIADDSQPADAGDAGDDNAGDGGAEDVPNTDQSELKSSGAPVIRLSKTQVVLQTGATFNIASYVEDIVDDKDESYDLFRRIQLAGDYQQGITNTPGTYKIDVYVNDSDGNQSNVEVLTLVVQ